MRLREHEQMAEYGKWRKARKRHVCEVVDYFGVRPHPSCTGFIEPNNYYWDSGQLTDSPFRTSKFCRFCADMELKETGTMPYEERQEYREKRRAM